MRARLVAIILAMLVLPQSATANQQCAVPMPRPFAELVCAASMAVSLPPTEARRGLPIGDILGAIGDVIGAVFRFFFAIVKGIFDFIVGVVQAIMNGGAALVQSVKAAIHGSRAATHVPTPPPGTVDSAASATANSLPLSTPPAGEDWRITGSARDVSGPLRGAEQTLEGIGRVGDEVAVRREVEQINRVCGAGAASLALTNHTIVKACLPQIKRVRETCSQVRGEARVSLQRCERIADKADDECTVEDSTEFFLELAGACHAVAVARR